MVALDATDACSLSSPRQGLWLRFLIMAPVPIDLPGAYVPWLETLGAVLLVAFMGAPNWLPQMYFIPPTSWLTAGRTEYVLAGILATCLLTTPLSRLPRPGTRRLVTVFMALVALSSSVIAFLAPALIRSQLLTLKTNIDRNGVCLQSNGYNCGPASAITALRRLGLSADEGPLAVRAHTSPATGTPPDILARTLEQIYGAQGLKAEYRFFKEINDLQGVGEVLAIIKFGPLVDHYVAVLEVTGTEIKVGDPLSGVEILSHADFAQKWRKCGVVITRTKP
jgi:hypothetical protein